MKSNTGQTIRRLKAENKQLRIGIVSQQRELLIAFTEWITIDVYETKNEIERDVDMYLSNL